MADIWLGTQERSEFVPCVDVGASNARVGYVESGSFLNGGAFAEKSTTGHKEYSYGWHRKDRDALRFILELASDVHGTGLIHWNPPEALDRNVLPAYFSAPRLAANPRSDSPSLIPGYRPLILPTLANVNNLPGRSAGYIIDSEPYVNNGRSIYITVPPASVLHFGYKGQPRGSATFRMVKFDRNGYAYSYVDVKPTPYDDPKLTNVEISGDDCSGVRVYLTRSTYDESSISLAGITAQILDKGAPAPIGRFYIGDGHSGCRFKSWPGTSLPGRIADKMGLGLTAEFIEVGAWETDANETENDVSSYFATLARDPDELALGPIQRNADGAPLSYDVRWPDGVLGKYTSLVINDKWPWLVDSYQLTYGGVRTFYQPTLTRNAESLVINAPEIVEI